MQIVFVHGAFVRDGAWWWLPVSSLLADAGLRSRSVALPSCGETGVTPDGTGPGLIEDAEALATLIDEIDDDVIVVASSYGGTVVAQGAARPTVRHLVYLSSFLPEIGQTHADVVAWPGEPVPVTATPEGSLRVLDDDPTAFDARFLQDVTDTDLIRGAHDRLTPQSPAALGTPVTAAAWHDIPSTYVVCAADRNTSPDLQRQHAARATHSLELDTGHHPFLSRPDLVAELLIRIATSV